MHSGEYALELNPIGKDGAVISSAFYKTKHAHTACVLTASEKAELEAPVDIEVKLPPFTAYTQNCSSLLKAKIGNSVRSAIEEPLEKTKVTVHFIVFSAAPNLPCAVLLDELHTAFSFASLLSGLELRDVPVSALASSEPDMDPAVFVSAHLHSSQVSQVFMDVPCARGAFPGALEAALRGIAEKGRWIKGEIEKHALLSKHAP